ncbi:unnamed protein product [Phaedon cochleariae]|uniref:DNA-directed DNA polymerase n=1 Tax=Phaedon cochleariae TaxID=80249 RepID=A0A9N9SFE6_PHACE|nr:unnamed protein product [Phaedon cochleariae]
MSYDSGYESDDDFDAEIIAWANWMLREYPPQLGHQPPVVDNENGAEGLLIAEQQNMEISNDDANNEPIVISDDEQEMEVEDEPIEISDDEQGMEAYERVRINVDALVPIRDGEVIFNYIPEGGIIYDVERLDESKLPSIQHFYNKLNDTNISDDDYAHAQKVWESFELKSLGEYSDLYMRTDILLLADVMENFRASSLKTYGLDPAWYYTMPGYSWDCMLKYTGCELQIIKDIDMVMFVEQAIRGGVSVCCNRYSEATISTRKITIQKSRRSTFFISM